MQDRICLITGANSGIGKSMATALARRGAHVVMVCRNADRAEQARTEICEGAEGAAVELILGDLSSMGEVRRVAEEVRTRHDRIDVLINNAGLYLPKRHTTTDGYETMFAVNHLAPFLLTRELEAPLLASGRARVVTVSSEGHRLGTLDFDDLQATRGFGGLRQYGTTKLANILFTRELARRQEDRGLVAHCFHPGAVATGFAQDEPGFFGALVKLGRPFLRSADRGARTGIHLATAPAPGERNGLYYIDQKPRRPSREARSEEIARRLWQVSGQLVDRALRR